MCVNTSARRGAVARAPVLEGLLWEDNITRYFFTLLALAAGACGGSRSADSTSGELAAVGSSSAQEETVSAPQCAQGPVGEFLPERFWLQSPMPLTSDSSCQRFVTDDTPPFESNPPASSVLALCEGAPVGSIQSLLLRFNAHIIALDEDGTEHPECSRETAMVTLLGDGSHVAEWCDPPQCSDSRDDEFDCCWEESDPTCGEYRCVFVPTGNASYRSVP